MKVCYVIAPYRADSEFAVKRNIERAENVALELWKAGFAVICPHKNTAFFGGACEDSVWIQGDKEILKRCDFAVICGDIESSKGSQSEIAHCVIHNIPVYRGSTEAIMSEDE